MSQNVKQPAFRLDCRFAALSLILLACGCVGPWANTSIPLPAEGSLPHQLDPTLGQEKPLPHTVAPDDNWETTNSIESENIVVRGQSGDAFGGLEDTEFLSNEMPVTDASRAGQNRQFGLAQYQQLPPPPSGGRIGESPGVGAGPLIDPAPSNYAPLDSYNPGGSFGNPAPQIGYGPSHAPYDGSGIATPYSNVGPNQYAPGGVTDPIPMDYADLVVNLRETQTGRFMFGVGVNSDLGLTAQAIIDERHFDWRRWPRTLDDVINGTAWRGGGQSLRIEAVPGTEIQRYLINFTQPYLWDTPISFNLSGYLYDRRYFDWDEQRLGGRIGFGYRITPDLSLGVSLRAEQVDFHDPRVRGIQQIEDVLGESDIFSGKVTLTHDTRDIPFAATEGHYLELSYEQAFGSFDFPRGNVDYRRYFLLRQRADRSGRHTMSFSFKGGITGTNTPVYENFFAGGYSTLRGFRFRHASPKINDVIVGGQLSLLGSAEYIFPITADDMLKGALFCDYGTIEEDYDHIDFDDFRVAIGAGMRISVPAMGPAPIAIDFAIPIAREGTDRIQNFSFFMGMMR